MRVAGPLPRGGGVEEEQRVRGSSETASFSTGRAPFQNVALGDRRQGLGLRV